MIGQSIDGCSSGQTGCTSTPHTTTHPPATVSGGVSCSQSGSNGWCTGTAILSLSANEPLSGYSITIIEGTRSGVSFACPGASCSVPLLEGQNDFTFWALSTWGDSSSMGSASGKLDSRPPQISGSLDGVPGDNGWYVSDVTLSASASDPEPGSGLASFSASVDGGVVSLPATLPEGSHAVSLVAADNAGLTASQSLSVNVDTLAPEVDLVAGGSFCPGCGQALTIEFSVGDGGSGITSWSLLVDGHVLTSGNSAGSQSYSWDGGGLGGGSHSLRLQAMDVAGNAVEASISVTVILPTATPVVHTATPLPQGGGGSTGDSTTTGGQTGGQGSAPTVSSAETQPVDTPVPSATRTRSFFLFGGATEVPQSSVISGVSEDGSMPAPSGGYDPVNNVAWGTAAIALIAFATATALDAFLKRKEQEAQQALQAQRMNSLNNPSPTFGSSQTTSQTPTTKGQADKKGTYQQDNVYEKSGPDQETTKEDTGNKVSKSSNGGKATASKGVYSGWEKAVKGVQIASAIVFGVTVLVNIPGDLIVSSTPNYPKTLTSAFCEMEHVVVEGDTLWGIMIENGDPLLTVDTLMSYNGINQEIFPGDKIKIPCGFTLANYLISMRTATPFHPPTSTRTSTHSPSLTSSRTRTYTATKTLIPSDTRWPTRTPTRSHTPTRTRTATHTATSCWDSYIAREGDTFASIVALMRSQNWTKYAGLTEAILRQANPNMDSVQAGQTIRIPCGVTVNHYFTATVSRTPTNTRTFTRTSTNTPTRTFTRTPTKTATVTFTRTITPRPSATEPHSQYQINYGFYASPLTQPFIVGWDFGDDENRDVLNSIPKYHPGVDIASGTGNLNVYSPISGEAYHYDQGDDGFGRYIVIFSNDGGCQVFAHLETLSGELVADTQNDGIEVGIGEYLGVMGGTGSARGAIHLHWEIRQVCGIDKISGRYQHAFPHSVDELTTYFLDPHLWP